MRRILRRAFNLGAAVSAVLFVGIGVLWVRCGPRSDRADHVSLRVGPRRECDLVAVRGYLCWCVGHGLPAEPSGWPEAYTAARPETDWGWVRRQIVYDVDDFGADDIAVPDFSDAPAFDLRPEAPPPATAPAPTTRSAPSPAGTHPYPGRSGGAIDLYAVADSLPLAASGLLPLLWVGGRCVGATRRRRRIKGGYCVACGYDLRATRDRCPECGQVPERKGARA